MLHNPALLAQTPYPATGFPRAQDGARLRRKAKCQHHTPTSPSKEALACGAAPQDILMYTLPVWEHAVITPLLVHGSGDVAGDEAGLLHGVNEVGRGLQHRVVGHEVRGAHDRAIVQDVDGRTVGSVSPATRQRCQRPHLQDLGSQAQWGHLTLGSGVRPAVNFRDREAFERERGRSSLCLPTLAFLCCFGFFPRSCSCFCSWLCSAIQCVFLQQEAGRDRGPGVR